jgi:hypothetical protein
MIKPVAWIDKNGNLHKHPTGQTMRPLYFQQPKRKWVGFTDEEMDNFVADVDWGELLWKVICIIEDKLKEKNND